MKPLAEQLRERHRRTVESLSTDERVALALELGEADLEAFCASRNLSRREGIAHFRRQRQKGRQPCTCMEERAP